MTTQTHPAASRPPMLDEARQLARSGDAQGAEQLYAAALRFSPDNLEALVFLAARALERTEVLSAIELLRHAHNVHPDHPVVTQNLGIAYRSVGNFDAALDMLKRAAERQPDMFVARLHLADVLEQLGHHNEALRHYFRALVTAQKNGHWQGPQSTPARLLDLVARAMHVVALGRRQLFAGAITPLREKYGASSLERVERALSIYLGDAPPDYADPRQLPTFFYMPGLPARPFHDAADFPCIELLEERFAAIREEALGVLSSNLGVEPVHRVQSPEELGKYLDGKQGAPVWDGYFFYRHGVRYEENCLRCPQTVGALEAAPLVKIPDHAPETMFSILTPGTHILPHRGITNTRLVLHLPLIVPEDCALSVAGEVHAWREGKCLVFDDTFEHEAWNNSSRNRVVLITDLWNPQLTQTERMAVTDLVVAIGNFNRECGL